jgi:hypothetical protein
MTFLSSGGHRYELLSGKSTDLVAHINQLREVLTGNKRLLGQAGENGGDKLDHRTAV